METISIAEEMSVCYRIPYRWKLISASVCAGYIRPRTEFIRGRQARRRGFHVRAHMENPLRAKQSLFPADRLRYWARTGLPSRGIRYPARIVQPGPQKTRTPRNPPTFPSACTRLPAYPPTHLRFPTCVRVGRRLCTDYKVDIDCTGCILYDLCRGADGPGL